LYLCFTGPDVAPVSCAHIEDSAMEAVRSNDFLRTGDAQDFRNSQELNDSVDFLGEGEARLAFWTEESTTSRESSKSSARAIATGMKDIRITQNQKDQLEHALHAERAKTRALSTKVEDLHQKIADLNSFVRSSTKSNRNASALRTSIPARVRKDKTYFDMVALESGELEMAIELLGRSGLARGSQSGGCSSDCEAASRKIHLLKGRISLLEDELKRQRGENKKLLALDSRRKTIFSDDLDGLQQENTRVRRHLDKKMKRCHSEIERLKEETSMLNEKISGP
jgi:hypothetical protein